MPKRQKKGSRKFQRDDDKGSPDGKDFRENEGCRIKNEPKCLRRSSRQKKMCLESACKDQITKNKEIQKDKEETEKLRRELKNKNKENKLLKTENRKLREELDFYKRKESTFHAQNHLFYPRPPAPVYMEHSSQYVTFDTVSLNIVPSHSNPTMLSNTIPGYSQLPTQPQLLTQQQLLLLSSSSSYQQYQHSASESMQNPEFSHSESSSSIPSREFSASESSSSN